MSRAGREGEEEGEEKLQISKSIIVNASLGAVFKAISDPEELTQWFPDQAILEPKVGGKMKFSFYKEKSPEHTCATDTVSEGIVKELIPNKKLSYTWMYQDFLKP
jgi:uncharacterized protein YndB with AHSA1/START domain